MSTALQRRLPGVRFDIPAPALREVLPRMDIALFVGFAASGPVDVPVAVESLAEFEAVFGPELTLLHTDDGEPVHGLLHGSLRGFFGHGGRRAWVVRVAGGDAVASRFPLQQMLQATPAPSGEGWQLAPAYVAARAPGAWADGLGVTTTVTPTLLPLRPQAFDGQTLLLQARGAAALAPGDTLRVALQPGLSLLGRVAWIDAVTGTGGTARRPLALEKLTTVQAVVTGTVSTLRWFTPASDTVVTEETQAAASWRTDGSLALQARMPAGRSLGAGELLQLDFDDATSAWLVLSSADATTVAAADGRISLGLQGRAWQVRTPALPAAIDTWLLAGDERAGQLLTATLRVAQAGAADHLLEGLALTAPDGNGNGTGFGASTGSLSTLPDDTAYFTQQPSSEAAGQAVQSFELTRRDPIASLVRRFPLASVPAPAGAFFIPLDSGPAPTTGLGPRGNTADPLERDGLARYAWDLFAEPLLADQHADTLADQAEALRLLGRTPRPLRGLHAALGSVVAGVSDEPTLLVLPDAVQPGWQRRAAPPPAWEELPADPQADELPCGCFDACANAPLDAPRFVRGADPDAAGHYTLQWTLPEPGVAFELQESSDAGFGAASAAYSGPATTYTVVGKPPGAAFYRVRATLGPRASPWSRTVVVRVGKHSFEPRPWRADDLLALHRLLLRTAAARGDLLAVLGLPRHYTGEDAAAHADALRSSAGALPGQPPPLADDETRALSFGALHHPWLLTRRVDTVIAVPPDGAIAGQLAAGALARGAWIAVANQPLRDVVALGDNAPPADPQAMLDAQVNLLRSGPRGFVLGSADTLSPDADWRPVNVRRLMSLLRRAALRQGALYVFEPNGRTLQRTVERAFNALLAELFQRGAFAGRSAREAYAVDVGDELNTPARIDAGQFRVDLKVAPALPLTFLRVRLARSGERLVAQEQR